MSFFPASPATPTSAAPPSFAPRIPSPLRARPLLGVMVCILSTLNPSVGIAADVTGTWEGKIRCGAMSLAGDEVRFSVDPVTLEISQSGTDPNTRVSGFGTTFPMDGLILTDASESKRARVALTNCANNGIASDSTEEVWAFEAVVGRPARVRGRRLATQFNAISDCTLRFKRTSAVDPSILSDCVAPSTACGGREECLVFLTSQRHLGDLGGLAGADALCQQAADTSALAALNSGGKVFRAWLGDDSEGPEARFTQASVPYRRTDGTTVASDWADLTDGALSAQIDVDDQGVQVPVPISCSSRILVWTAAETDGGASETGQACERWTNSNARGTLNTDIAVVGDVHYENAACGATPDDWTRITFVECDGSPPFGDPSGHRLYCFEQ